MKSLLSKLLMAVLTTLFAAGTVSVLSGCEAGVDVGEDASLHAEQPADEA